MKINQGGDFPAAARRPQSSAVASNGAAPFSTILTAANADPAEKVENKEPDFTRMTRKEMFDWMNGKIIGGEMSLDDSSAFLGMTIRIPVAAGFNAPLAIDDREQVDFVQLAQDGIAGALSRHDDMTRKMLETAMQVIRHEPGSRVDQRA
ncbi:hypothetical protein E5A73_02535 [Sphingomonas gei]|uniref:Uncharacterized protein n=1 Tax=Sphingomonas gei TaxID=1395960 RepID=A0A4S1XH82_9SPHN|nr:hypothetical protein [Sphingomonas gei]TGX56009.1 hypothetical protein E5A73_02535 [Sphingomonas gei]